MDEKINAFKKGDLLNPEQAMQLAISVAGGGAAYVSPNPLVGCVIVDRNHQLLATGFHAKCGADHAEIDAVKKLHKDELKNSTMYVTLEPCAHEGKTPSCAKHIAGLAVKKIVYGLIDPNPLISGQGAQILIDAGKTAVLYEGPLKEDLEDLCEIFLKNYRDRKVFVAAKVATSLDGQIALKSGESKWITGPSSREFVHELRSRYDAIIVGRNTVEVDDPALNIRHETIKKIIKVVVLDPSGSLLKKIEAGQEFKFLLEHNPKNIFFATRQFDSSSKFNQIQFDNLSDLNDKLWKLGIRSVFIEGGSKTYSSYLNENLIDRLHVFVAPVIMGARTGMSWTKDFGIESLDQKKNLMHLKIRQFSNDIYMTGKICQ